MGIREDAGELLAFFYREYIAESSKSANSQDVKNTTTWDAGRINRAITYLKDAGLIKIQLYLGNKDGVYNFHIRGLTPAGINIIEDEPEFEKTFGITINLGVIQLSWERTKK